MANEMKFLTLLKEDGSTVTYEIVDGVARERLDNLPQSDWNENDEASAAYVKNRPFYTGEAVLTTVVDNVTFTTTDYNGLGAAQNPFTLTLEEGVEYVVTWNGTDYTTTCTVMGGLLAIGNGSMFGMAADTGEPFLIGYSGSIMLYATSVGSVTITIKRNDAEVHKISSRYIDFPEGSDVGLIYNGVGEVFNDYENNTASGSYSHAEGAHTEASGNWSHAEGYHAKATGTWSHAEGYATKAAGEAQHVQGKYNIEDTANDYAHIVGNGTSSVPANIHTLDWDGGAWYKGGVKIGGTSYADAEEVALSSHTHEIANVNGLQSALDGKAASSHTHSDMYTKTEVDELLETCVRIDNNNAYAIYDSSATTLYFVRSTSEPSGTFTASDGTSITCTNVYSGIETDTYSSGSSVPWYNNRSSITSVRFIDMIKPVSTAYWFHGCTHLTSLDVSSFDTSIVTNTIYMFYACSGLTSLDLSSFDTSNVTSMGYMFYGCSGLTSLDLSNFDTSSVVVTSSMFYNCSGLTSLDLSNFDTSNVTNMFSMFYGCSGLTSLDLSSFDTSNVTSMFSMFEGCSGLTSLDLSSFDTSNVTSMDTMFYNCSGLTTIYASDLWTTEALSSSTYMFANCTKLVGDIAYNISHLDATYAKTSGGYLTYKTFIVMEPASKITYGTTDLEAGVSSLGEGMLYFVYEVTVFYIDDVTYNVGENMTWGEWVNSSFNTSGFYVDGNYLLTADGGDMVVNKDGLGVKSADIIEIGYNYGLEAY